MTHRALPWRCVVLSGATVLTLGCRPNQQPAASGAPASAGLMKIAARQFESQGDLPDALAHQALDEVAASLSKGTGAEWTVEIAP